MTNVARLRLKNISLLVVVVRLRCCYLLGFLVFFFTTNCAHQVEIKLAETAKADAYADDDQEQTTNNHEHDCALIDLLIVIQVRQAIY